MSPLRAPLGTLGDHANGRDNNFNLIRFIAASAVLFSHCFAVSTGQSSAEPLRATLGTTFGQIAVDVFFLASGFLVTASLLVRGSARAFVVARCLRIYPGLFVAVAATTLVVGLAFTTLSPQSFFASRETWIYLLRNAIMVTGEVHTLPGAFEGTPWRHAVNGSLWTLPYELSMYLALASIWVVLTWLRALKQFQRVVIAIALIAALAQLLLQHSIESSAVRLVAVFFLGSAAYCLRGTVTLRWSAFFVMLVAVLAASFYPPAFKTVYFLCLPYLVLFLAYAPAGRVRMFNRLGDCSYGLYVYAWPVQQATVALLPGIGPIGMLMVAFPITLSLAVASWKLIEKPALALKERAPPNRILSGAA